MSDYQKGYNARQDGEKMNYDQSTDWQCGWYAAEYDIARGEYQ